MRAELIQIGMSPGYLFVKVHALQAAHEPARRHVVLVLSVWKLFEKL